MSSSKCLILKNLQLILQIKGNIFKLSSEEKLHYRNFYLGIVHLK